MTARMLQAAGACQHDKDRAFVLSEHLRHGRSIGSPGKGAPARRRCRRRCRTVLLGRRWDSVFLSVFAMQQKMQDCSPGAYMGLGLFVSVLQMPEHRKRARPMMSARATVRSPAISTRMENWVAETRVFTAFGRSV
ncbi:hypothetical protein PMIN04_003284 [Paraphaeosphaeria minitans]